MSYAKASVLASNAKQSHDTRAACSVIVRVRLLRKLAMTDR